MKKYLVIDVDGTLTDSSIYYDERGNEIKKFSSRDAAGIFAARASGIDVLVLTGRESSATQRRLNELGIELIYQNVANKRSWLQKWMKENGVLPEEMMYIGDDLNDLFSMKLCSYIGCPADACTEIKEIADYISPYKGGNGAVRDFVEHYLRKQGDWNRVISRIYNPEDYLG